MSLLLASRASGATLPYTETFETFTTGQSVAGVGDWRSGVGDQSTVIATDYVYSATSRPLPAADHHRSLHLQTTGSALTNLFTIPPTDEVLYFDCMARFIPRDRPPDRAATDPLLELLVYLGPNETMIVCHGGINGTNRMLSPITGVAMSSGTWHRLTATLDFATDQKRYFMLHMDGIPLTCSDAYSLPGLVGAPDGGNWFYSAETIPAGDSIDSLVFEGRGDIDSLVLSDASPIFGTPLFRLRSSLAGAGSAAPAGDVLAEQGSTTQIIYSADTWHEIADLTVNGGAVPSAAGLATFTAVHANVQSDISNRVVFAVTRAADGKTPATWYGPLGANPSLADEDGDGLELFEEYLLNTDPTATNTFAILEFSLDPANVPSFRWLSAGAPNGDVVVEHCVNQTFNWSIIQGDTTWGPSGSSWRGNTSLPDKTGCVRVRVEE